ncbi:tRNA (adenosine(37)-N6)-threonylcarbamoyltransferase complex dimerization subunit type 1 TsaB [soil metagenome]
MGMPTILAIETSTELASAALTVGTRILTREASGVQTHSHALLPMVQSLFEEAGFTLAQCDAVAFGAGPGSFTGVRTACGVAQGLAFGLDLPLLPVVTLLAMAQACHELTGEQNVLCVLDARMGEVYWAQYRHDGGWHTVIEPSLSAAAEVKPHGRVFACGNGLDAHRVGFEKQDFMKLARFDCMPHARYIALLAQADLEKGGAFAARDAQPLYLRNKVALTTSERSIRAAK